uniref:Uncharacterized protein n=1 Tax=Anguilla anguilla TaxID=7936 RepID=A0A0E9TQB4_ANGAN
MKLLFAVGWFDHFEISDDIYVAYWEMYITLRCS